MTYRLIYVSRGKGLDSHALHAVGARAAAKNEEVGITGALIYRDGRFVQLLEGDHEAVARTMSRIDRDPRHFEVTIMLAETCADRLFPDSWMALIESRTIIDRVLQKMLRGLQFNPVQWPGADIRRFFEELSAEQLVALDVEPDDIGFV